MLTAEGLVQVDTAAPHAVDLCVDCEESMRLVVRHDDVLVRLVWLVVDACGGGTVHALDLVDAALAEVTDGRGNPAKLPERLRDRIANARSLLDLVHLSPSICGESARERFERRARIGGGT